MTVSNAKEILSVSDDHIARFIQDHASAKTLSVMMKQLNDDLLAGDQASREIAAQAIGHLGFPLSY